MIFSDSEEMIMNNNSEHAPAMRAADVAVLALMLGAVWGLCEAVLGGVVRSIAGELRAGVLTAIGMMIMGFGYGVARRPMIALSAACVGAATMLLAVPVLGCSFLCRANSMLAVALHGVMLAGCLCAFGNTRALSFTRLAAIASGAALLSSTAFYFGGMRLAPCAYLLSFGGDWGLVRFLVREGAVGGALSAALLPSGAAAGAMASAAISKFAAERRVMAYGASAAWVAGCLLLIAL